MKMKLSSLRAGGIFFIALILLVALLIRIQLNHNRVSMGVSLEGRSVGGWKKEEVEDLVRKLALGRERVPRNAIFAWETGEIIPDESGQKVDVKATVDRVLLARKGETVELVMGEIPAMVTAGFLQGEIKNKRIVFLAGAKTPLVDDQPGRVVNIQVAVDLISKMKISPGGDFSFNQVVGLPTLQKGFREAPIISDSGGFTQEIGGGICQVSSTLYQAVQKANLRITEHHPHSQEVSYTPRGTDATVVPGEKDLCFVNNREKPVVLFGTVREKGVEFIVVEVRE
jgi:vancomycin resistance protein YoaR